MARATAKGFQGRVGALGNSTNYQTTGKVGGAARAMRTSLNRGHGNRMVRAILLALTGAAVGAASKAYSVSRLNYTGQAGQNTLGGLRKAQLVTKQTGVTVAQDLTDFDQNVARKSYPATYPANKSGYRPGSQGKRFG